VILSDWAETASVKGHERSVRCCREVILHIGDIGDHLKGEKLPATFRLSVDTQLGANSRGKRRIGTERSLGERIGYNPRSIAILAARY
jgi:hypothetical protein